MESDEGFVAALGEARASAAEGGIPIGACLVAKDGRILGKGHNMRVQNGSAILHAEIAALENAGRLPGSAYVGATMYTTLSPCYMCTGACLLFGITRVVVGENKTYLGGEALLKDNGVEVTLLNHDECHKLMGNFIKEKPDIWSDIAPRPLGPASGSAD